MRIVRFTCITRRKNARLTSQRIYFEACVIGKTIKAIFFKYKLCLQQCISFKRIRCFRDIIKAIEFGKTYYFI